MHEAWDISVAMWRMQGEGGVVKARRHRDGVCVL